MGAYSSPRTFDSWSAIVRPQESPPTRQHFLQAHRLGAKLHAIAVVGRGAAALVLDRQYPPARRQRTTEQTIERTVERIATRGRPLGGGDGLGSRRLVGGGRVG